MVSNQQHVGLNLPEKITDSTNQNNNSKKKKRKETEVKRQKPSKNSDLLIHTTPATPSTPKSLTSLQSLKPQPSKLIQPFSESSPDHSTVL